MIGSVLLQAYALLFACLPACCPAAAALLALHVPGTTAMSIILPTLQVAASIVAPPDVHSRIIEACAVPERLPNGNVAASTTATG
jgi:hypothetical protein